MKGIGGRKFALKENVQFITKSQLQTCLYYGAQIQKLSKVGKLERKWSFIMHLLLAP